MPRSGPNDPKGPKEPKGPNDPKGPKEPKGPKGPKGPGNLAASRCTSTCSRARSTCCSR
jgi:hypothetical protein